jgi:hypothetical protein
MSDRGIEVGEQLRDFRGILTGVPEYSYHKNLSQSTEANL